MTEEIILGIDTALQTCAACLLVGGKVRAVRRLPMEKGHAEHLAPMVADLTEEAAVALRDVDRVGIVHGPGGFTGLRVGLAFARAMALGAQTAVIGVNSLEALAYGARSNEAAAAFTAPVIDARRGQVYAALYDGAGVEILAPFVSAPEGAFETITHKIGGAPALCLGTGAALMPQTPPNWRMSAGDGQIDPTHVALLAAQRPVPSAPPAPLYLRPPDAKPPSGASVFDGLLGP